jgi:CxxC motif-containing protein (DUF1111 family)
MNSDRLLVIHQQGNTTSRVKKAEPRRLCLSAGLLFLTVVSGIAQTARDPGVRGGAAGAGGKVAGLTSVQLQEFPDFTAAFNRVNTVVVTPGVRGGGLGPRFNSNGCASCHAQPATGGSSPRSNPLFSVYQLNGATNTMPSFIKANGPVLNARFPFLSDHMTPDGQIKQLFTITGRSDATGCDISQPDFVTAAHQNNLVFRQPIPLFGDGLIDQIPNSAILANQNSNTSLKQRLGISGHPNVSPTDGVIRRFGWKAQVRTSKEMSALEQQVQKGVTNQLFPGELDTTPGCVFNGVPEDSSNYDVTNPAVPGRDQFPGDTQRAAIFVRFLDQPTPSVPLGTTNGQAQFNTIGCVLCHTQSFVTGKSTLLSNHIRVNLFSDLLVHHMGACLADHIVQGSAQGDEFRTAPLWNVGQRIFFLHDGRYTNIVQAIEAHFCNANGNYGPSEANAVIHAFNALSASNQQDLVNWLRTL